MFGLFKKRRKILPTFAPLVTDVHCHLLPQVDDGSKSLEMSIEVLEAMSQVGFKEARLTPHYQYPRFPNEEQDILRRFEMFKEEVERNRGEKELPRLMAVSGEYRVDSGFEERSKERDLLTFRFADATKGAEKGLLLLEFSLHQPMMGAEQILFNCQMDGYDVILAHPERYPYLDSRSPEMESLKEQGVYFQVNILSLDGYYGELAKRKAFDYIERGWVEFLGTDMHNTHYSEALLHASSNKAIIRMMEKVSFMNKELVK